MEAFERGTKDEFLLHAEHVGALKALTVWHDNFGPDSDWYLEVTLQPLPTPSQVLTNALSCLCDPSPFASPHHESSQSSCIASIIPVALPFVLPLTTCSPPLLCSPPLPSSLLYPPLLSSPLLSFDALSSPLLPPPSPPSAPLPCPVLFPRAWRWRCLRTQRQAPQLRRPSLTLTAGGGSRRRPGSRCGPNGIVHPSRCRFQWIDGPP